MMKFLILLPLCLTGVSLAVGQTTPANRVSTSTEGNYLVMRSNGIPNHKTGQFPNRGNPNAISEKSYTWRIPLHPQKGASPTPSGFAWFGVAINGVPMEPGTQEFYLNDRNSGWKYEALGGTSNLGIDESLAHVQPNGAYHYHGLPTGLIESLGGDGTRMLLVGWAADGFPIYTAYGYSDAKNMSSPLRKMKPSYRLKQGTRPTAPGGAYDGRFTEDFEYIAGLGDLDECNGRFGPTPEFPSGIYHYHITEQHPFISRFWRGQPDASFQKQGPPPGMGSGGQGKGQGPGQMQGAGGPAQGFPPMRPTPPARPTQPGRKSPSRP